MQTKRARNEGNKTKIVRRHVCIFLEVKLKPKRKRRL